MGQKCTCFYKEGENTFYFHPEDRVNGQVTIENGKSVEIKEKEIHSKGFNAKNHTNDKNDDTITKTNLETVPNLINNDNNIRM
jgi:hypothetical protein